MDTELGPSEQRAIHSDLQEIFSYEGNEGGGRFEEKGSYPGIPASEIAKQVQDKFGVELTVADESAIDDIVKNASGRVEFIDKMTELVLEAQKRKGTA